MLSVGFVTVVTYFKFVGVVVQTHPVETNSDSVLLLVAFVASVRSIVELLKILIQSGLPYELVIITNKSMISA